jgi:TrmH family RNA methyltransferase
VTSAANATVKLLRSLERKKARTESGLFLAEGARLAEEGLAHGWRPAHVLAGAEAIERPKLRALLTRLRDAGARVLTASPRLLASVAKKDNPQTILTAFEHRLSQLDAWETSGPRLWVALYEIRDPGNLGTILRTADAAGADGVALLGPCCDPFSIEAVRASMGSIFAMPLALARPADFTRWTQTAGARVVAATMQGDRRHDEAAFGERCVLLLGNEQVGLPAALEAAADARVRIPMRGAADSLNLAAAAAVLIYEAWRARGFAGSRP